MRRRANSWVGVRGMHQPTGDLRPAVCRQFDLPPSNSSVSTRDLHYVYYWHCWEPSFWKLQWLMHVTRRKKKLNPHTHTHTTHIKMCDFSAPSITRLTAFQIFRFVFESKKKKMAGKSNLKKKIKVKMTQQFRSYLGKGIVDQWIQSN